MPLPPPSSSEGGMEEGHPSSTYAGVHWDGGKKAWSAWLTLPGGEYQCLGENFGDEQEAVAAQGEAIANYYRTLGMEPPPPPPPVTATTMAVKEGETEGEEGGGEGKGMDVVVGEEPVAAAAAEVAVVVAAADIAATTTEGEAGKEVKEEKEEEEQQQQQPDEPQKEEASEGTKEAVTALLHVSKRAAGVGEEMEGMVMAAEAAGAGTTSASPSPDR